MKAQSSGRRVVVFKDLDNADLRNGEKCGGKGEQGAKKAFYKVPSLLFDIELEDGQGCEDARVDEEMQDVLHQLKSLVEPRTPLERNLTDQVRRAHEDAAEAGRKLDAQELAQILRLPGYTFKVRAALGGGWGGDCLRQLRHFFLTCIVSGTMGPVNYVIDPCFREQFEIANPSVMYQRILSEIPREFVGTEECIAALVVILSNEIRRSFQATGGTLPPWRHPASMLSKWRPRRSEDITVAPSAPSVAKDAQENSVVRGSGKPAKESATPSTRRRVSITANSTSSEEVVTAKPAADSKGPTRGAKEASPKVDIVANGVSKRARDFTLGGAKCSSVLAAKLRGVSSFGAVGSFPSVFKGQA